MEDYIFLIIAVAISIFAAINKSRKANMADQPLEETDSKRRNFFMDQLLGEDFLEDPEEKEEKEEKKTPPMRVQPVPSKIQYKSISDTWERLNYKPPKFKSTLPDRPKHVTIVPSTRQKEEISTIVDPEETISYLDDFSLRKAIVYSLILERKY